MVILDPSQLADKREAFKYARFTRFPLTASQLLSLDVKLVYDFFFKSAKPAGESVETIDTPLEQAEPGSDGQPDLCANLARLFSFLDQSTLNYTSAGKAV